MIDRNGYVIIINPSDSTSDDNIASAQEIKARGATIIGISNRPNEAYDIFIKIPFRKSSIIYTIIKIIPSSDSSILSGACKECNPDYPCNLAKSVTIK